MGNLLIIIVEILIAVGFIYIIGLFCRKKSVINDNVLHKTTRECHSPYSDADLTVLQYILFRFYARNVFDGNPRGWAISYSEVLLKDLESSSPQKWRPIGLIPRNDGEHDDKDERLKYWLDKVLICDNEKNFRIIDINSDIDKQTLAIPMAIIRADLMYFMY